MSVRELLVMRHAKSDWEAPSDSDFDRPLSKRGRRDCERIAAWLDERNLTPDRVVHSTAVRTTETVARLLETLDADVTVVAADLLYLAGLGPLVETVRETPDDVERLLVVGHNPGMDEFVTWLAGSEPPRAENGKLMVTAAVARFRVTGTWEDVRSGRPELVELVRPREL